MAICDPNGAISAFAELFGLAGIEIAGVYVQQLERCGSRVLGRAAQPLTELAESNARSVFVAAFDAERLLAQLEPYLPPGARSFSLDWMRIPPDRLTNRRRYLDPLNFATNFAFFRDTEHLHTRLSTANYWPSYGGGAITCWMTLFGESGQILAEWCEECGPAARSIVLDSREIRARFRLPEFCGQLFPARGRRGRARCRQIRARYVRRRQRPSGGGRGSIAVGDPRRQRLAGRPLRRAAGAGSGRAGRLVGAEQPP